MGDDKDPGQRTRVDERDTMFARMERAPDTPAYEDYYARHPERRGVDDRLRRMTPLLEPGSRYYDITICGDAREIFSAIESVEIDEECVARAAEAIRPGGNTTLAIKDVTRGLGAVAVGCTDLDQSLVYSNKGRFDADYGDPVVLDHASAIVFLVEMDFDAMQQAPTAPVIRESARQYHHAARIGKTLEAILRAAGHDAKAHYDAHYDVILPPLAVKAGLGELGRNNLLVADRFGSRVRIGAVTTNCPVEHDGPVNLGVAPFCEVCRKCSDNCPPQALSGRQREMVRGVEKWPTRPDLCHGYWRHAGTDCGICMASCPFSHPDTPLHRSVRWVLRRAPWRLTARVAMLFEDSIYGREWATRTEARASARAGSS